MGMSVTALMDIMATIARLVMALQPSLVENNFDYHMKVIYSKHKQSNLKYQTNDIFYLGDPCSDWECQNGGHCVWQNEPNFLPRCQCEYDYEGPHCETTKLYSNNGQISIYFSLEHR